MKRGLTRKNTKQLKDLKMMGNLNNIYRNIDDGFNASLPKKKRIQQDNIDKIYFNYN